MKLKTENASAAIIIDDKNNFLLQKRDKKTIFFPGHWGLFGGAKNKNESYIAALKREINEEIGFIPKKINFFFKLQFSIDGWKQKNIKRYFYICKVKNLHKLNIKLNEGEKFGIFSNTKLQKDFKTKNIMVPYDHFALWFFINKNKII